MAQHYFCCVNLVSVAVGAEEWNTTIGFKNSRISWNQCVVFLRLFLLCCFLTDVKKGKCPIYHNRWKLSKYLVTADIHADKCAQVIMKWNPAWSQATRGQCVLYLFQAKNYSLSLRAYIFMVYENGAKVLCCLQNWEKLINIFKCKAPLSDEMSLFNQGFHVRQCSNISVLFNTWFLLFQHYTHILIQWYYKRKGWGRHVIIQGH